MTNMHMIYFPKFEKGGISTTGLESLPQDIDRYTWGGRGFERGNELQERKRVRRTGGQEGREWHL